MDLVGAESRRTGTRGGRADFTWDTVKDNERQYYLGNSLTKPIKARLGSAREHDWYTKPVFPFVQPTQPLATPNIPKSAPAPAAVQSTTPATSTIASDLQAVRRREKAIMERMIDGCSFADAVRSALTESVGSGVDDEGHRDAAAAAARRAVRKREKTEKAQRKEMRRRVRELRRVRRAERSRRTIDKPDIDVRPTQDTSESERENLKNRAIPDDRRRRRRERDSATRRKRSDWSSTSDSEDFHRDRSRRRLR